MRGIGGVVLALGVLVIILAMAMDVSVPSGLGRVNNIGLMARQQNFLLVGGLMLLVGVIMAIAGGGRRAAPISKAADLRACPACAEEIKLAAVKCKHCGADVEPLATDEKSNRPVSEIITVPDGETRKAVIARVVMYTTIVGIILVSWLAGYT